MNVAKSNSMVCGGEDGTVSNGKIQDENNVDAQI